MAKRASKIDRKLTKPDTPRRPRSQPLPGMEDQAIRELEAIATDYADYRDRRQALGMDESRLKREALALMHKHRRTHYKHNGIEITLEPGEETIKVRVKKPKADADETDADADVH